MAAPTITNRQRPTGRAIPDGYRSLIGFEDDPDLAIWERSVKPPGYDGGDPIDTSTMHNNEWRTKHPRSLKTMTEATVVAGYKPTAFAALLAMINNPQSITCQYPDGTAEAFFGFVQKIEKNELKEGEYPECTLTICPMNEDGTGAEQDPVYGSATGS